MGARSRKRVGQAEALEKPRTSRKAGDQGPAPEPAARVGGRPPREELGPEQLKGLAALMTQPTIAAAADEIGVHPRTLSRWMQEPPFRAEYMRQMNDLQHELWRQVLSARDEAWNRFLELLRSGDERIAVRAATWYLDRMLSVPPILRSLGAEDGQPNISPRVRMLLAEAEEIERGGKDDAA